MKKTLSTIAFISVLLLSALAGVASVKFAEANFTVPVWMSSPKNITYNLNYVSLKLESTIVAYLWEGWYYGLNSTVKDVCYSLDGKANKSIPFTYTTIGESPDREAVYSVDSSLKGLTDCTHHLTVYLRGETYDNASYHQCFNIDTAGSALRSAPPATTPSNSETLEAFPTSEAIVALIVAVVVVSVGLLVYSKKNKHNK